MSSDTNAFFTQFNQSVSFDKCLWEQDIKLSIVHATMLARQSIITSAESDIIIRGLQTIGEQIRQGNFEWNIELEDLHMNIEHALIQDIGEVGKKLHTGRSRNDQVATAMRMYVAEQVAVITSHLEQLCHDTAIVAEQYHKYIMPGFTHLQAAQPITFGHHLLAWEQMFARDRERLLQAKASCLQVCPLGAAALAGTPHPIDPQYSATELGFQSAVVNSLDSVSDRDFILDVASALSIMSIHLTRCAEDLILWMSSGFKLVNLASELCASSSIMPQKQNPDIAELVRAKSGRVLGALQGLLVVFKGQPVGYNKDNQEDKQMLFDALQTSSDIITAWNYVINGLQVKPDNMLQMAQLGHSTATDLADLLTVKQIPFRQAYKLVGQLVALADKNDCNLWELDLAQAQEIIPVLEQNDLLQLTVLNSVNSRTSKGGTACVNVASQAKQRIDFWQQIINAR